MTLIPTIYNADTLGIRPDLVGRDDHDLGGHPRPGLQGQDLDPQHPVDRHHGRRDDLRGDGQHQIRRQGQHDQGGDRQDHRLPDQGQEGRPVPRLLEDLRRERQPDGLGRSGDPVDVVAGRRRRALEGHPLHLPAAQGRLSLVGRRPRPRRSTSPALQLDAAYEYINWYLSGWVGGYLNRQGYYSAVLETAKELHVAKTSGASGSRASRPRATSSHPKAR